MRKYFGWKLCNRELATIKITAYYMHFLKNNLGLFDIQKS